MAPVTFKPLDLPPCTNHFNVISPFACKVQVTTARQRSKLRGNYDTDWFYKRVSYPQPESGCDLVCRF